MLNRLVIQNYALIENLTIDFHQGLNIMTGETGAGKSIIMGGLSLILGQRAESKYFFHQQKKCVIEGHFDVSAYHLVDFFREHDLDFEDETILRREISPEGKSRAFINDTPVNLNLLKSLGTHLIDIHSQHATLQVSTEAFQRLTIDSVAQNQVKLVAYQTQYREYRRTLATLADLRNRNQQALAELDYNRFVYEELALAQLDGEDQAELEAEQNTLAHAEEIKRTLIQITGLLQDEEGNASQLLKEATQKLQHAVRYMDALEPLAGRLDSCLIEVRDIADELSQMEQRVLLDEERLEQVGDRLGVLYALQQKHRVGNVSELIQLRDQLKEKLSEFEAGDEETLRLEQEAEQMLKNLRQLAYTLSESRQDVLPVIKKQVEDSLTNVGMPESRLEIQLESLPIEQATVDGADRINFLFSANKGQVPLPLDKVASGGELSRLMLSIKTLMAKKTSLPTIIFDEIDTGISGEVALRVGEAMEVLSSSMQVIAITHLPQIAAKGQAHFKVFKQDHAQKTITGIRLLDTAERVLEIAQMLSGAQPGEAALQHAKELLEA